MVYKPPKTIDEQLDYLYDVKNVRYNVMSRDAAKEVLIKYGYINVITPFKHWFFKQDKKGKPIKDENGLHIYEREIEFKEYYDYFCKERTAYPTIYSNIMKFEETFNAIVSYELIQYYRIVDRDSFIDFISLLKLSLLANNSLSSNEKVKMQEELDRLSNPEYVEVDKYDSIFITFDRLSLNQIIVLFRCSDKTIIGRIFKYLLSQNLTFKCTTYSSFNEYLIRLPQIRNYVCHSNSLEILINYLRIKDNKLRTTSDKSIFMKLIKILSEDNN